MTRLYLFCLFLVVLCSCSDNSEKMHIGRWEATIPTEEKIALVFEETTVEGSTLRGDSWQTDWTSPYKIDYSKKPIWLDVTTPEGKSRCILEFIDSNTFRMAGRNDEDGPRPSTFEDSEMVVTFHRK